jgi:hypothetical protein
MDTDGDEGAEARRHAQVLDSVRLATGRAQSGAQLLEMLVPYQAELGCANSTFRLVNPLGALIELEGLANYLSAPTIREAICLAAGKTDGWYPDWLHSIIPLLRAATPIFWTNELFKTAEVAANSYDATGERWRSEWFLAPVTYWAYETDRNAIFESLPETWKAIEGSSAFSRMLICAGGQIACVDFMSHPKGVLVPMPNGEAVRVGDLIDPEHGAFVRLAGVLAFLDSPYVSHRPHEPTRAERRRWSREHGQEPMKIVNVVTLRRRGSAPSDGGEVAVDWTCRWFVRGHWRRQWYPVTKDHHPVWIAPYVKGPEDKPIKVPAPTVFAVVR